MAESAELVKAAAAVLTHDTGLMHVAAAYRKPIVSVWGNTVPAFGMYPYLPGEEKLEKDRRVETLGLDCRPAPRLAIRSAPKDIFAASRRLRWRIFLTKLEKLG